MKVIENKESKQMNKFYQAVGLVSVLEIVYFFHISFLQIGNFPSFLKGSSEEIDFLQFSFRSDWL